MNASRRDEYTAAAIELLDRHGPATQTLGVTASEVCEVASFHRSTLYRHFETITEMNDAVAIWLAVTDGDWRTRLCDVDPGLPLRTALHLALGQPSDPASMWMRGVVASWNPDHPARHAVTRIEEGRQRRFQDWLHTHLRQKGLRPVRGMTLTALATGIAAQVEGEGMLRFIDLPSPEHHVEPRESLVAAMLHLVQELSEPGTPGTREITAEAGDLDLPIEASMQRRLRALSPQLLDRRPEPTRLVNVGRLARRLGVQERRLYAMWPTALDMNVDLARAVLRRERDRLDDLLAYLFESTAEQPVASLVEVLARCGHRAVAGPGSSGGNCFALMGGLLSPEHRVPLAEQFDGWAADLRTSFLAGQALTRWYRRPGVSPNDLARSLRWTCFGSSAWRDRIRPCWSRRWTTTAPSSPWSGPSRSSPLARCRPPTPRRWAGPPRNERSPPQAEERSSWGRHHGQGQGPKDRAGTTRAATGTLVAPWRTDLPP